MHLWFYAYDGSGLQLLDILSKILVGISETIMAMLFFLLASGWKVRFQDIDYDDNLEIHIPLIALVCLIQIVIAALTIIDFDASHKYHDYSGIQGWCLFALKIALFFYLLWCYCDSKRFAKKHKD